MVFDAHARVLVPGRVPRRGIYDNLKPAVDAIFLGRATTAGSGDVQPLPDRADGVHAGLGVGEGRSRTRATCEWVFTPKLRFADLAELNAHRRSPAAAGASGRIRRSPSGGHRAVGRGEIALRAVPMPFRLRREERADISHVPGALRAQPLQRGVSVRRPSSQRACACRADRDRLRQVIGEHPRCFERGRTLYNPWHYAGAGAQARALRNGAPFKDWLLPGAMTRLRERLFATATATGSSSTSSRWSPYGLDAVAEACAAALEEQVVSSAHVVNLLHRAAEPARPLLQVPMCRS
ncbi:MAG: hypothetical protein U1F39_15155 [Steroidobacteraceae bacterium]